MVRLIPYLTLKSVSYLNEIVKYYFTYYITYIISIIIISNFEHTQTAPEEIIKLYTTMGKVALWNIMEAIMELTCCEC